MTLLPMATPVAPQAVAAPTGFPAAPPAVPTTGAPGATPSADPTAGFAALVAQLMGLAPTGASTDAAGQPAPEQVEVQDMETEQPTVPTDEVAQPTAPELADTVVVTGPGLTLVHSATSTEGDAESDTDDLSALELEPMLPTLGPALAAQLAVAAMASRTAVPTLTVVSQLPAQPQASDATVSVDAVATGGSVDAAPALTAPEAATSGGATSDTTFNSSSNSGSSSGSGDAPATGSAAPAAQAAPAVSALAPTAPTAPTAVPSSPTVPAPAVHRQVFPEVTRLVSAGNGTHRVTLQLAPEALGEVRVTLTMRDGQVHVRLHAGDEAQRALLEGAPELRRLLEATGASDTKIVVRDLGGSAAPGAVAPAAPTSQAGTAAFDRDGSFQGGPGTGNQGSDQNAWTRGGSNTARDGISDGSNQPRHVDQVTRTRSTGVDVTV